MRLKTNILEIDVKCQDRYRKWFSSLGTEALLENQCVILGDSDIDYELAPNIDSTRILSAPFNVEAVKHKLIYNGVGKNLAGSIKVFARKVLDTGVVQSLYNYPLDEIWSTEVTPPILTTGKSWEKFTFDDSKMGYILFFSTVLDFYLDANDVKKRLKETYTVTFDWNGGAIPLNWEFTIDNINGSLLLAKDDTTSTPIGVNYNATITIVGDFSQKTKKIFFNI